MSKNKKYGSSRKPIRSSRLSPDYEYYYVLRDDRIGRIQYISPRTAAASTRPFAPGNLRRSGFENRTKKAPSINGADQNRSGTRRVPPGFLVRGVGRFPNALPMTLRRRTEKRFLSAAETFVLVSSDLPPPPPSPPPLAVVADSSDVRQQSMSTPKQTTGRSPSRRRI